jgi:hypothetical protein
MDDFLDLDRLRLSEGTVPGPTRPQLRPQRSRAIERFLKGPIPLAWVSMAAGLPGKALHVGIAIWFRSGLERSPDVILSLSRLAEFGTDRHAGRRGLAALENAGLVSVVRHRGRAPRVRLARILSKGSES